ncbi:MAG: PAS domain-containing protein [Alphaproteobacteria bacterium]|nr:MAG: PAS domain-containing protein [Alphaproteobacteria bacterium]
MSQHASASTVEVISGPSFVRGVPAASELERFRARLETESARALWDYWRSKFRDDVIPLRADIQPAEMKELLPYLLLWEWAPEEASNRIRLAGTALVEALQKNPARMLSRDVFPAPWEQAIQAHAAAFYEEQRAQIYRFSMAPFGRTHITNEFLALPLRRDTSAATMGIGVAFRIVAEGSPLPIL